MNQPHPNGSHRSSQSPKPVVPESQLRALDRRHILDRQQNLFRTPNHPLRGDRSRPPG